MRSTRVTDGRLRGSPAFASGFAAAAALLVPAAAADPDFRSSVLPVLERYCVECHGGPEARAGLELSRYASAEAALADPREWALVRELLAHDEMPPLGRPRPTQEERAALLDWIDRRFGSAAVAPRELPAAPAMRRLNRTEYRNSVRDIVGIDFPVAEHFPADEIGHGFDTVGDALGMPDLLFERYLEAAERIAEQAIVVESQDHPPVRRFEQVHLAGDGRPFGEAWILTSNGEVGAVQRFPREGEYLLRASAYGQQAGPEPARMTLRAGGKQLARFEVAAVGGAAEVYEVRARIHGGERRVAARFLNDYYRPDDPDPANRDRNLVVEWIEVVGPLDPPSLPTFQRELFARFGAELGERRAREMLACLARRAWRRPAAEDEIARLEDLAASADGLAAGLRLALQAILVSPSFLFRPEPDPAGAEEARELDGFELATRLSYFLWSTTPDEELLELAERGTLVRDDVLRSEIGRLLDSWRSRALAERFAAQWLGIDALEHVTLDTARYPAFDRALAAAMRDETLLFFDAVLREERSVFDLLEGDFSFVNEPLAALYGIPGVRGDEPRRVSLEGLPRRGVLTHASVLTVTSDPTRTSPVKRGKWILEALLGAPPPPPPPGTATLDESSDAAAASLRERLELHRVEPGCAVCHAAMDPLGFGLENFDAIGAWRERDGDSSIDAAGSLPDGRSFDGPLGLAALVRGDEAFLRSLAERLLVYALGRGLERADRADVDALLAGLDPEHPTLRALIEGVALSDAFRTRRAPGAREPKGTSSLQR